MFYFEIFVFCFLGLILGSFATAIYYRESIKKPWWSLDRKDKYYKSLCPSCDHVLRTLDLIPVLSYLMQKGRCRYCLSDISKHYLFIELFCFFSSIAIYLTVGFELSAFLYVGALPFAITLVILSVFKQVFSLKLLLIFVILSLFGTVF